MPERRSSFLASARTGTGRRAVARCLAWGFVLLWPGIVAANDPPARAASKPLEFEAHVEPILKRACQKCHGPEKQRGGLRLDSRASMIAGGDSGEPAIEPGNVEAGVLLERVSSADTSLRMPPRGDRLSRDEIDVLRRWIAEGAAWRKSNAEKVSKAGPSEMVVTDADREHWAFRPLRPVEPPAEPGPSWVRTPIDRFVQAAMKAKGLSPAAEAARPALIRRAAFDLGGLPPSPEEIATFVNDPAPDAYERLVDRLLASPAYGERWGRHWLDLARHADSDGYEGDRDRRTAWRYRDFVIRALNEDMPFDQFLRWQIAGDEYEPANPTAVAATGFCTAAPSQDTTPADTDENKAKIRYDELDNVLATIGSATLGLTLGCARCHDHKFDPVPTRDYYRMLAAFTTTDAKDLPLSKPHRDRELWLREQRRLYREDVMARLGLTDAEKFWLRQPEHFFVPVQIALYKQYGKRLDPSPGELRAWMNPETQAAWKALDAEVARAEARGANRAVTARILLDRSARPETSFLLGRGSVTDHKEVVTLGFIQVLTRGSSIESWLASARARSKGTALATTYQRSALAEWLTDDRQGAGALVARVAVNRLWQHHFGEGLCRTPDDLGLAGERPALPELFDWLAGQLIRSGWRLKPIQRLIVTSALYRQGTAFAKANAAVDPENRLYWHRRPVRLEVEVLRDAMLSVSGRLNPAMYGPSFRPSIPPEAISTRSNDPYPTNLQDGPETCRRSVYAFVKRSVPNPFADVFDAPDSTATCGRRNTTAVPTQNLALMNDPFVRSCARALAERVVEDVGDAPEAALGHAYLLALGRPPRATERADALRFLSRTKDPDSLADFCHVLITLNEFLYVD